MVLAIFTFFLFLHCFDDGKKICSRSPKDLLLSVLS